MFNFMAQFRSTLIMAIKYKLCTFFFAIRFSGLLGRMQLVHIHLSDRIRFKLGASIFRLILLLTVRINNGPLKRL